VKGWEQDQGANIAPFNGIGNIFGKLIGINFAEGETKDSLIWNSHSCLVYLEFIFTSVKIGKWHLRL
jgi:hypothetical protein